MSRLLRQTLLTLLFLLAGFSAGYSQYDNHLVLKRGFRNVQHFLNGDSIRFMRNFMDTPTIGVIEAIGEDFIVIRSQVFPLQEINTVYRRRSFNYKAGGRIIQIAGPAFLGMAAFNALYNSIRPILTYGNLITGGSLFLAGTLMPLLQQRKYELGGKFHLRIVPSDPVILRQEKQE